MKKTVVFDFDGVIHSYSSGWQGMAIIPDSPVEGIGDVLKVLKDNNYEVVIVSTRCATKEGRMAIRKWLRDNNLLEYVSRVTMEKPPATVYVDDRAICFTGETKGLVEKIMNFKNWLSK